MIFYHYHKYDSHFFNTKLVLEKPKLEESIQDICNLNAIVLPKKKIEKIFFSNNLKLIQILD